MKKKLVSITLVLAMTSMLFCGCSMTDKQTTNTEPVITDDVSSDTVEEVAEEEYYDDEFLTVFAEAITRRQELGEKIDMALTTVDVLEKELAMHPDYATKKFKDDVLKTYAVHYREAVETQKKLYAPDPRSGKKLEGYLERDFDDACNAWIVQIEVVNALVRDYDLPISDLLVEEYRIEQYFWMSGLYKTFWKGIDNTKVLFEDMEEKIETDDEGLSTINLNIKNATKYDLSGIHILVYHLTKNSYVLEKEIPVDLWEIDGNAEVEFSVKEKYSKDDHIYAASSGLALTMYPNRVIWF